MIRSRQTKKPVFQTRGVRIFNEELKKQIVDDIEYRRLTIKDVVNLYKVSNTAVRKWIKKYSIYNQRKTRMVVESQSTEYQVGKLFERISELERSVGKKQMEIEFLYKVIDICSDELGYDVKKKNSMMQLNTIDKKGTVKGGK